MSITHRQALSITSNGANSTGGSDLEVGDVEIVLDQTFVGGTNNQAVAIAFSASALQSIVLVGSQNLTLRTNGANEVQQLAMTGPPSAGTFTLTFNGQTTAGIAYNAAASVVQTALENLSNIGIGDVACTGGPLPGTPVAISFQRALGLQDLAALTSTDSLTGGSTSLSTTTPGAAPDDTINLLAGNPLVWGRSPGYFANPFSADVAAIWVSCATSCRLQGKILHN